MSANFKVFPDFLQENVRSEFLSLTLENWNTKNLNYQSYTNRGYFNLNDRYPDLLPRVETMLDDIMTQFNVPKANYLPERHYIGINVPIGYVVKNNDPSFITQTEVDTSNWVSIRFNSYLQSPESGGYPSIDDKMYILNTGDALAVKVGARNLNSPVVGNTMQIVFSIGCIVDPQHIGFLEPPAENTEGNNV